jgi:hypothetical protein
MEQTRLFTAPDRQENGFTYLSEPPDEEVTLRFQARIEKGKVKLCSSCGEIMAKSSRMILSPLSAVFLLILGVGLMVGYGMAVNFYQTPWFLKFALPAMYYIGSIYLGVGLLFFFIRERVWVCHGCKETEKR